MPDTRSAPARRCRCSSASSRAGVPLGVTFSFLISAPMVNEVALGAALRPVRLEGGRALSRHRPG
ncbi:MAG: hypothetical protein MZV49_07160 [Rhodopseudomonas palustris]|nr:hypothetical protein [Rhodopseudomonas palustris]